MMKRPLIVANWKLNGSKSIINQLIIDLRNLNFLENLDLVIVPPVIYLDRAYHNIRNSRIFLGAQNVDIHDKGSFTGEISATMLKDVGVSYVIIGHSERRIYHNEDYYYIAKKLALLKLANIVPILCIGEDSYESNIEKVKDICFNQLKIVVSIVGIKKLENIVIAYEPRWAIGSNKTANLDQIQSISEAIYSYLLKQNKIVAQSIRILYGGSVNTENSHKFVTQIGINGLLIGKASLNVSSLKIIIENFLNK